MPSQTFIRTCRNLLYSSILNSFKTKFLKVKIEIYDIFYVMNFAPAVKLQYEPA